MNLPMLRSGLAHVWSDYREYRNHPHPDARTTIPSALRQAWHVILCSTRGHNIEDQGHAGPDSGCIDLTCTRCGWHHKTWLY